MFSPIELRIKINKLIDAELALNHVVLLPWIVQRLRQALDVREENARLKAEQEANEEERLCGRGKRARAKDAVCYATLIYTLSRHGTAACQLAG